MIYLLHGDRTELSRAKLIEIRSAARGADIREIDGKRLDRTALIQAIESTSLFGGGVLVVIDQFLTNAKKREKTFSVVLASLLQAAESVDIVLYEGKEIDKPTVSKLGPNAKVFQYKTPVVLFQFLDSLRPGNARVSLPQFAGVVSTEPAEVVSVLMLRRVRQLLQCKDGITPDGMADWQAGRLTSQAGHFTIDQLVAMHSRMLEIEIAVKTGNSPFSLTQLLEQLIIQL